MEARAIGFQPGQGWSVGQRRTLLRTPLAARRRSGRGAVLVEPVDPRQGLQFELVDVVPHCRGVGTSNALSLVEPIRRLGQRVINESATVPIEGRAPISSSRSVNRTDVNCDPASACATSPTSRRLPRERLAISSASRTISVRMFAATRHPTIRRENASTMKHTYAIPVCVGTYVKSVTHNAISTCINTASRTARADGRRRRAA